MGFPSFFSPLHTRVGEVRRGHVNTRSHGLVTDEGKLGRGVSGFMLTVVLL